ncbi:response regulator receiver domain protein [Capnocytophaga sp. oral taxon 335 str. F0486]|uniref:LytR/AlgR family response regulator transcription factor n=1 Tax=Capnocytophaga sp. oral taxon 335 TaxID=712215 RepID=UPI00026F3C63|nr:LytTR family DNA-binding domain-containing protein [Capnocytophaga sp. oral taxon 335]EJF35380.1 response regulator receiver domain protein [Capnocytophaga sp. oral taxon 335 str. F0486]
MNCLIIDDEPLARIGMERLVRQYSNLKVVGTFKNAVGVADFLKKNEVHLLFLDIEMPGVNGLEFAKTLPEQTLVIFTTAYSQYALDSYEVDALEYLVKPITPERFKKAVTKAESYLQLLSQQKTDFEAIDTQCISVRANRRNYRIPHNDILYIEALKDYVIIHTFTDRYITWINLKNVHSQLPESVFVRVNKSFVVNIQHVTSYTHQFMYVGETEIPIGRTYQEEFLAQLKE